MKFVSLVVENIIALELVEEGLNMVVIFRGSGMRWLTKKYILFGKSSTLGGEKRKKETNFPYKKKVSLKIKGKWLRQGCPKTEGQWLDSPTALVFKKTKQNFLFFPYK